jgi:hypothetical protein
MNSRAAAIERRPQERDGTARTVLPRRGGSCPRVPDSVGSRTSRGCRLGVPRAGTRCRQPSICDCQDRCRGVLRNLPSGALASTLDFHDDPTASSSQAPPHPEVRQFEPAPAMRVAAISFGPISLMWLSSSTCQVSTACSALKNSASAASSVAEHARARALAQGRHRRASRERRTNRSNLRPDGRTRLAAGSHSRGA